MKLSVVVPVHNEESGIDHFHQTLTDVLDKLSLESFEILYINDGSSDRTIDKLHAIAAHSKSVKIISFTRNFGKEIALAAGITASTGDAVITIDADDQQPPNLIPDFLAKWQAGAPVVTGIRKHYQKHGVIAKLGSKLFYFAIRKMGADTIPGSTDYRLIDRSVVEEFKKLTEHNRITRGLID